MPGLRPKPEIFLRPGGPTSGASSMVDITQYQGGPLQRGWISTVRANLEMFRSDPRTRRSILNSTGLTFAIVALFFLLATMSLFSNEREELENVLTRLVDMVERMDVPRDTAPWRFLYVYDSTDTDLEEITEPSTDDWEQLHNRVARMGNLRVVCLDPPKPCPDSWINSTFHGQVQGPLYGASLTPFEADSIFLLKRSSLFSFFELTFKPPSIRLWFARNADGVVYILSHIRNADVVRNDFSLRMKVYFNQSKTVFGSKVFLVEFKDNGGLQIGPSPDGRSAVGLKVGGWESESDWYFKFKLTPSPSKIPQDESVQIDAVELLAATSKYQIGTRGPLPLQGYIDAYAADRNLFHMTPHYELYRRFTTYIHDYEIGETFPSYYYGSGIRDRSIDLDPHKNWLAWLLTPLYQLYFFSDGIKDCSNARVFSTALCYRQTREGYRLRVGKDAESSGGLGERNQGKTAVSVFMEKDLIAGWDATVATMGIVVFLSLGFTIYYRDRGRLRILRQYEQINKGLKSYDDTFIHQAKTDLTSLENKLFYLEQENNSSLLTGRLEAINRNIESIRRSLVESTDLFTKEKIVREYIDKHRHRPKVDVAKSINHCIDILRDSVKGIQQIQFYNNVSRIKSGRLLINSVGPSQASEDASFGEALKTLIVNAHQHGDSDKEITVSLDVEEGRTGLLRVLGSGSSYAVIRVSNYGPKVPDDVLEKGPFVLGVTSNHSSQSDHHGIGLFLVSQIVTAYGGNCRLDNFYDPDIAMTGVVATLRLPAEFKIDQ